MMIIDEPERHLHPNAQREVARWLVEEVSADTTIFIATHALPFLNLRRRDVRYSRVARVNGVTLSEPIDDDVLGQLHRQAEAAGLSSVELIQLARGFLVVEGKHDEEVLRLYFARDLAENRLEVLPLRGTNNAKALVDLEFLDRQGIPIGVLFDNVSRAVASGREEAPKWMTKEERVCIDLRRAKKRFFFAAFEEPDIICAFPEDVVRSALSRHWPGTRFVGWESLKAEWKRSRKPENFKYFAIRQVGLLREGDKPAVTAGKFFSQLSHTAREFFPDVGPRDSLARAFRELLAQLDQDQ
jgi:hypothetical protein